MPGMQTKIEQYMKNLGDVGDVIMRSYAKGLSMPEDFFTKHFKRPSSLLRLIKYPPTEGGSQGIGEHADYGFLTLIDQDDVGGLQAKTVDGDWIDVTPISGSFAVNIGDTLEAWTKLKDFHVSQKLRSTPHRVINRSTEKSRLSIAYFYEPELEMKLPDGIVLERNSKDPVSTYGEHIYRSYAGSYPNTKTKDINEQ